MLNQATMGVGGTENAPAGATGLPSKSGAVGGSNAAGLPGKAGIGATQLAATAGAMAAAGGHQWVYRFGGGLAEGHIGMKDILGGKGAGLHQMAKYGLRVPPGFTISAEACQLFDKAAGAAAAGAPLASLESALPSELWSQVEAGLRWLEQTAGASLGGIPAQGPAQGAVQTAGQTTGEIAAGGPAGVQGMGMPNLLVSVRSGAAVSMPGMMDTVLNLGIAAPGAVETLTSYMADQLASTGAAGGSTAKGQPTQASAARLAASRFALDCLRRHIDMFGCIVMGMKHEDFEGIMLQIKKSQIASSTGKAITSISDREADGLPDTALTPESLKTLTQQYLASFKAHTGQDFPTHPRTALKLAILAVLRSWHNTRAVTYRAIHHITGLKGTAVNVQAQVFGNMGDDSGSGVLFTRDPSTGANQLTGEFLVNAQGEDVVAGIRTPIPIAELERALPGVYADLLASVRRLEQELGDMQDVEFTVQRGVCYILQTRNGKRTGAAALRIAMDMVNAGTVDIPTALSRLITPQQVDQLLHKRFSDAESQAYKAAILGKGIAASPGAAVGQVVFEADDAVKARAEGKPVILVRPETSAEDVAGMHGAEGILTTHGGMTSHAAVVARGWGKTAVCGAGFIHLDLQAKAGPRMIINLTEAQAKTMARKCTDPSLCHEGTHALTLTVGDWLSVNGTTGEVLLGQHERTDPAIGPDFLTLIKWAKQHAPITVRANADSGDDVAVATRFGAAGVGLCRTEHMFWGPERITHMRAVILAPTPEARQQALQALFPFQKDDFLDLFIGVGQSTGTTPVSREAGAFFSGPTATGGATGLATSTTTGLTTAGGITTAGPSGGSVGSPAAARIGKGKSTRPVDSPSAAARLAAYPSGVQGQTGLAQAAGGPAQVVPLQPAVDASGRPTSAGLKQIHVRTPGQAQQQTTGVTQAEAQTHAQAQGIAQPTATTAMPGTAPVVGQSITTGVLAGVPAHSHKSSHGATGAYPVTVRLLDPPLHEYLPNPDTASGKAEADKVASTLGIPPDRLTSMIRGMREANPMLGHRGCRVEITHPEIPRLQTRAVITAAAEALSRGVPVEVQIMIPLITGQREMAMLRSLVEEEALKTQEEVCPKLGVPKFPFRIGNMLETPRAALTAATVAQSADFFSFGTNDLTALTFGFSRDDAPKFIPAYIDKGVLSDDPFQSLDTEGVGQLVAMAVERGRQGNPQLEVGVCGEVGGDERSVHFFVGAGVDYVSVSPFRVPAAWVAAAQAGLARMKTAGAPRDATA